MYKRIALTFCFLLASFSAVSGTIKTYDYNERDQVLSITSDEDPNNPITFTYDESGNRISKTHNGVLTEYKWSRGDLVEVSRNGMWFARYRYDYKGLRISKQIRQVGKSTQETRYTYDGTNLLYETNVLGNVIVRYHWANGELIGETRNDQNYFYFKDGLGSIIAITAQDGSVVARIDYDAFGNVRATQGTHVGLFGFTGYYADDETGLYYAKQRYYDSELGAFISEDPLEGTVNDPQSQHRYNYAKSNPTKYVDKDGRCSSVVNMMDVTACDRYKEGFTNPEVLAQTIKEIKLEGAMAVGVGQAVGDIVTGTLQTAKDLGGTYVEAATGGRLAKGSMLRLRGQVDSTIDFVRHPIDTVKQAINNNNEIVAALEAAGDFEGAMRERSRFATTGLLSVAGGGAGGVAVRNKFRGNSSLPIDPPPPKNDMTGIVMEGGGNNLELSSFSKPNVPQRNTWQQSEMQVLNSNPDFNSQVSFLAGEQVRYGTKGSVRPEGFNFVTNTSIEVKNYNVMNPSNRSNLISNIVKQIGQRKENLPSGSNQMIHIDVKGQDVSLSVLETIKNKIIDRSGGVVDGNNIIFER